MRKALFALLIGVAAGAYAAPPSTCGQTDDYSKALCLYQKRDFIAAHAAFQAIVDRDVKEPATLRSMYFLARTDMKLGRFDEAAPLLMRIYSIDPAFYATWNCDFLLGECRKAAGKD